jgi:Flp pilus assembly pilin Flp
MRSVAWSSSRWNAGNEQVAKVSCRTCWDVEDGQGMVEYALILAFVAVATAVALSGIAPSLNGIFKAVASAF